MGNNEKLTERCFQLEQRIENLQRIKDFIASHEIHKRTKCNRLIRITKRKHRILEKHLLNK